MSFRRRTKKMSDGLRTTKRTSRTGSSNGDSRCFPQLRLPPSPSLRLPCLSPASISKRTVPSDRPALLGTSDHGERPLSPPSRTISTVPSVSNLLPETSRRRRRTDRPQQYDAATRSEGGDRRPSRAIAPGLSRHPRFRSVEAEATIEGHSVWTLAAVYRIAKA